MSVKHKFDRQSHEKNKVGEDQSRNVDVYPAAEQKHGAAFTQRAVTRAGCFQLQAQRLWTRRSQGYSIAPGQFVINKIQVRQKV